MDPKRFLEFGSVTYTQRAKALLHRSGIEASLSRSGISNCSYGLWINASMLESAKRVLDGANMRYKR